MTPFEPPPWTIGRGDRFSVTASAVAGRSGRFGCPAKVSLGARRIAKSLQPNDATRWWRTWDPASRLFFALRDAAEAVDKGATIDEATAADPRLTAPSSGSSGMRYTCSLTCPTPPATPPAVRWRWVPRSS